MTHLEVAMRLIVNQEKLLAVYRMGGVPSGNLLDSIYHDKKWLRDAGLLGGVVAE